MAGLIAPEIEHVPKTLAERNQWLVWKAVPVVKKDGSIKITKIPYNPTTGRQASSSKPASWSTFEAAVETYLLSEEYGGIGFVFSADDDLVGIDLDNCVDAKGKLNVEAQNLISLMDSYTELSPSGTGLHVICRGHLPGSGHCDNAKGHEMYQHGRFFTITAKILAGKKDVAERKDQVTQLYHDWFGAGSVKDFKAGDLQWDDRAAIIGLDNLPISEYARNLIRSGEGMDDFIDKTGSPDRSLAIFYVCREMVSSLVNKETILSILTDPSNYLASAALDRRDGDIESAQQWIWKYSLSKILAQWEEERLLFDEVMDDGSAPDEDDEDSLDVEGAETETASTKIKIKTKAGQVPYTKGNFEKNALLFLKHEKPLIRYNEEFYTYTGKHWEFYSEEQFERDVHRALSGRDFGMGLINNTIKTIKRFSVRDDFNPSPTNIAFRNGVLDLEGWDLGLINRELSVHSPAQKTMSYLNFDYDPEAVCLAFLSFIHEVFEGDEDCIALLRQYLGYILVYDYRWQKMLIMAGESRSGKGTLAGVIRDLVGHKAFVGTSLTSLAEQFGLHPLLSAKVAVLGDAKQAAKASINRAHEVLLTVTGNDFIPIRRMYSSPITAQIPARLILMANNVPRFADDLDALHNRFLVLPFNVSFKGREDVTLAGRLKAEMPGIFNWAVEGLLDLAAQGRFTEPSTGLKAAEDMRVFNNPLGAFVSDFLKEDAEGAISCRDLYAHYQSFCREVGMHPMPNIAFGRRLAKTAPWMHRVKRGTLEHRVWTYTGVKIDEDKLAAIIGGDFE